jgi:hypothetical protein
MQDVCGQRRENGFSRCNDAAGEAGNPPLRLLRRSDCRNRFLSF